MATVTKSGGGSPSSRYLTVVPRGLELACVDVLRREIGERRRSSSSDECFSLKLRVSPPEHNEDDVAALRTKLKSARRKKDLKRRQRESFRKKAGASSSTSSSGDNGVKKKGAGEPPKGPADDGGVDDGEDADADGLIIGSVQSLDNSYQVNFGRHGQTPVIATPGPLEGVSLLFFDTDAPATVVASVRGMGCGPLMALVTSASNERSVSEEEEQKKRKDGEAPRSSVVGSRTTLRFDQTLEEAQQAMRDFIRGEEDGADGGAASPAPHMRSASYVDGFRDALSLWHEHARDVWFGDGDLYDLKLGDGDGDGVDAAGVMSAHANDKFHGRRSFAYRVSCLRSHSGNYKWKRHEAMPFLADLLVPYDELSGVDLSGGSLDHSSSGNHRAQQHANENENEPVEEVIKKQGGDTGKNAVWKVDLTKYDFEVLALLHHNSVTVAIPLRPYRHVGSRSYSRGKLAPDVTPPYITGHNALESACQLVRLRPSTAALLLSLANTEPGDVVLDPFAGVGTIPLEASLLATSRFGLGGDVALGSSAAFATVASGYAAAVGGTQRKRADGGACGGGAADVAAWDAALLPLRDGSVDAVVSDLPFGVKCLTAAKLAQLLPLAFRECARVLRPGVGRMVLLCGSYQPAIDALTEVQNARAADEDEEMSKVVEDESVAKGDKHSKGVVGKEVFQLPCSSVFPVNIGGLSAWVVIVKRGDANVAPMKTSDRLRVKKLAASRKRVEQSRAAEEKKGVTSKVKSGRSKFRRIQSI